MDEGILTIVLVLILAGLILGLIRFIKGPSAADRAVALDNMSISITSVFVLLAFLFERYIYIDVALIYAVLGFIGIIVVARYLERAL
ncbi:MAG: monovalent cation/H+ antiporter complex subunit F [Bacteroidota bacterium]